MLISTLDCSVDLLPVPDGDGIPRLSLTTDDCAITERSVLVSRGGGSGCRGGYYQRFLLDRLAKLPGVATYPSSLIATEIKRTTALPV
jgi:hypothetical protein